MTLYNTLNLIFNIFSGSLPRSCLNREFNTTEGLHVSFDVCLLMSVVTYEDIYAHIYRYISYTYISYI